MQRRGINQPWPYAETLLKDNPNWKPGLENFQYSSELVTFIP